MEGLKASAMDRMRDCTHSHMICAPVNSIFSALVSITSLVWLHRPP